MTYCRGYGRRTLFTEGLPVLRLAADNLNISIRRQPCSGTAAVTRVRGTQEQPEFLIGYVSVPRFGLWLANSAQIVQGNETVLNTPVEASLYRPKHDGTRSVVEPLDSQRCCESTDVGWLDRVSISHAVKVDELLTRVLIRFIRLALEVFQGVLEEFLAQFGDRDGSRERREKRSLTQNRFELFLSLMSIAAALGQCATHATDLSAPRVLLFVPPRLVKTRHVGEPPARILTRILTGGLAGGFR